MKMANAGVSMNIAVFKELNDQLNTVGTSTDIFKNKIGELMGQLKGLSSMVATMPGQFNNLSTAMAGGNVPASVPFDANKVINNVNQNAKAAQDFQNARNNISPNNLPINEPISPQVKNELLDFSTKPGLNRLMNNREVPNVAAPIVQNYIQPAQQAQQPYYRQYQQQPRYDDFQKMANIEKLKSPEGIARTSEQIDNLTKGLSSVDKTIAKVLSKELSDLKKEFADGSDMFKKYNESLNKFEQMKASGATDTDLEKAAKELSNAAAAIKENAGKLNDASKASEDVISQSPDAQKKAGRISGITQGLGVAAFAAQAAGAVSKVSFDFYKDMEAKDITAGRDILAGRGALAQKQAGIFGEQFNLYNARNLMKWGGDLMAPGLMQYGGQEGFGKAKNKAVEELAREQQLKQQEARSGLVSGGLDTIGNVLKAVVAPTIAGALLGGPAGALAGLAISGSAAVAGVMSANGMAMNYAGSAAQEMTGGKANTLYGKGTNWLYGNQDASRMAENTRTRWAIEQATQIQGRGSAYQESEVDRMPWLEQGIQKYQNAKQARYQAMSGLGAYAGLTGLGLTAESKASIAKLDTAQESFYKNAYSAGEKALTETPALKEMATPTLKRRPSSPRSIGMDLAEGDDLKNIAQEAAQKSATSKADARKILADVATQKASEDVKKLTESTISDVFTREMARDDKGNFTNHNMRYANLGLGTADVQQRAYQYQQSLGIGQMKTTEQAVNSKSFLNLNKMSLAGLGSFDQLAGNITALSQLSGGSSAKNEGQLENILAKGVAAGFNNSRLSQSLVQTTTDIASSLNLRNVAGVTTTVLDAARAIGGGTIDERNMRDAAASIQQYAQFTGQKEGPMGMLNMAAALKSGFTPGKGRMDLALGLSNAQLKDMEQQISQVGGKDNLHDNIESVRAKLAKDPSLIKDPAIRSMLAADPKAFENLIKARKESTNNLFENSWKQAGNTGTLEEAKNTYFAQMNKKGATNKDKAIAEEELRKQVGAALGVMGMSKMEGGFMADIRSETNTGKKDAQRKFLNTKNAEAAIADEQKTQAGFDQVLQGLGQEFAGKGLSAASYAKALTSGKMKTTIDGKQYTGEELQKELARGDKDFNAKAEARAHSENMSTLSAKRDGSALSMGAAITKTNITGIEIAAAKTLADAISTAMKATPLDPSKTVYGSPY
jgi:hypothetical protein